MRNTRPTMPKVSIMIPTFNQELYIEKAIHSALEQTYPNIEIIVADDSSTDNTESLVHKFKDTRLTYIKSKANLGRVRNYHRTLYEYCQGDWAVNLDGDDYYTDPFFIQKAVSYIKSNEDLVMVSAGCKAWDGRTSKLYAPSKHSLIIEGSKIFNRWDAYRMMHLSIVYNRRIAMRIGFYEKDIVSTDWESFLRLMLHGKVGLLKDIVGVWRKHENNETRDLDFDKFKANMISITSPGEYAIAMGLDTVVVRSWINKMIGNHVLNYLTKNLYFMRQAIPDEREGYRQNIEKLVRHCHDEGLLPFRYPLQHLAWKAYLRLGPQVFLRFFEVVSRVGRSFGT